MKKSIFTLAFLCAALAGMTLTSCSKNNGNEDGDIPSYPEAPGLACVKINGIWWAPVNCGYDATNYPYGKLYQWGRHDGCGYNDGSTYTETIIQTTTQGPIDASQEKPDEFYKTSYSSSDWLKSPNNTRWNIGTEASPVKTQYDPCPTGWRVPTYDELNTLTGNSGATSIGSAGWDSTNNGYWFNGTESPKLGGGLFLPASGRRGVDASNRDSYGFYWSSSVAGTRADILDFGSGRASVGGACPRESGISVRCVKE